MKLNSNYINHWDSKFQKGKWGRYPPEELVRFMGRNYKEDNREKWKVLEAGCGPGANIWFLHREGYQVFGIDGSPSAIEQARNRIETENFGMNRHDVDLRVGNFSALPWEDNFFDVVVDVFSIYANTSDIIDQTLAEVYRVLKTGGKFFFKVWGKNCTGFGEGEKISENTFNNIPRGPCAGMGVSHFFDEEDINRRYIKFEKITLDRLTRTDMHSDSFIEEYIGAYIKR